LIAFVGEHRRIVAHFDQASSIKVSKSLGLTGVNFVRFALMSRSAHRRRMAVFKSNPVNGERGCAATAPWITNVGLSSTRVAFVSLPAISLTTASGRAFFGNQVVKGRGRIRVAELGVPLRNSAAIRCPAMSFLHFQP
jgi:hypothetical protein